MFLICNICRLNGFCSYFFIDFSSDIWIKIDYFLFIWPFKKCDSDVVSPSLNPDDLPELELHGCPVEEGGTEEPLLGALLQERRVRRQQRSVLTINQSINQTWS